MTNVKTPIRTFKNSDEIIVERRASAFINDVYAASTEFENHNLDLTSFISSAVGIFLNMPEMKNCNWTVTTSTKERTKYVEFSNDFINDIACKFTIDFNRTNRKFQTLVSWAPELLLIRSNGQLINILCSLIP